RRHTRWPRDWSSDVCSSDLASGDRGIGIAFAEETNGPMTALREKIKTALDESRMLVLGAQIFLGFHFRAVFEPGFERLSKSAQYLKMAALMLLLIGVALILSPGSYHRIVRSGSDAEDVHTFATTVMDFALIPF